MIKELFLLVTILSLLLLYYVTGRQAKLIIAFIAWQLLVSVVAVSGVFMQRPNLFPFAIAGTIILTVFGVRKISTFRPDLKLLLSIHVLRIPVEWILFELYLQKKIPVLMTFKGWNFDILMGISALVLLLYIMISKRSLNRRFFIFWNVAGLLFLTTIVLIALFSSPLPIQQLAFDQPNIAVMEFPYSLLPTCIVPAVVIAHILALRRMNYQER